MIAHNAGVSYAVKIGMEMKTRYYSTYLKPGAYRLSHFFNVHNILQLQVVLILQ